MFEKVIVIAVCTCMFSNALTDDLLVELPDGKIQGHILNSYNGYPYYAFQEIPYAAPPVGENRFTEPRSPEPWSDIRDATKNTKKCVQFTTPPLRSSDVAESEDCLYLNVYTPQKPGTDSILPVYVFVHGGSFVGGSGDSMNPNRFLDYNIIVVTLNYRLGALGFISSEDDVIPGNLGLKDQALGIRWVNSNIQFFGGDPNKITIGGESAGAFSIGYQLLGLGTSGLFRGAIQESGSSVSHMGYSVNAKTNAFNLGRAVNPNFQSDSSEDLLSLLRSVPFKDLVEASSKVYAADDGSAGYVPSLTWLPVIEGYDAKNPFITSPMLDSFITGSFHQVPILIGQCSEEALMFIGSGSNPAADYDKNSTLLVDRRLNIAAENANRVGTELKKIYTNSSFVLDQAAFVKLSSDAAFTTSMLRQAEEAAKFVPVYYYQFSYMGFKSIFGDLHNLVPGAEGVGHAEDLAYLFDDFPPESESDLVTRNRLLLMWTNFVKYLNPTPTEDPILANVVWTPVQNSDIQYLNINDTLEMKTLPRYYSTIRQLLLQYVQPPYTVF